MVIFWLQDFVILLRNTIFTAFKNFTNVIQFSFNGCVVFSFYTQGHY